MKSFVGNRVGMPAAMYLEEFASKVWSVFGTPPYQVGSSLCGRDWHDVDVRLILDDDEWERWEFGPPAECGSNDKWVALCMAFSALGTRMTGLPIDFQIQQQTDANKKYEGPRNPLGFVEHRMSRYHE